MNAPFAQSRCGRLLAAFLVFLMELGPLATPYAHAAPTGLAAEPMSCPPDAFNSGIDVIFLAPQARHLMTFTIGCDQHESR